MNRVRPTFVKKATVNLADANVPMCGSTNMNNDSNYNCWGQVVGTSCMMVCSTNDSNYITQACITNNPPVPSSGMISPSQCS